MNRCPTCGEQLQPDELCGVCMLTRVIDPVHEAPDTVGRYRILRLLGEGGMGSVYEAEQEHPRRTVALKVLRGTFIGPDLLRRFERESQALARLHHPGIAQVYEAGATDCGYGPQPFFAMELVQGEPLNEYAEHQDLSTRQRLELMARVCDAVQHAHERGIIHRDLKPGNILVDPAGQPKILDFGVARMTHANDDPEATVTYRTSAGQLMGTPAYMSPEQVLGDPLEIDTRSDVYTLGVILYELLAGRLPYTVPRQFHEAARVIREQDPPALGAGNRIYRGDIETIAGKALEKDKARRYASAAELSADIRRYLGHQPITARPPSATYLLGKFARRHRTLVAGVAAVFLTLLGGIMASMVEAGRARLAERSALAAGQIANRQRDRAVAAEGQAESARNQAELSSRKMEASAQQAREERDRAVRQQQRADTEAANALAISEFLRQDVLLQASSNIQARTNSKPDPDLKVRTALDRAAARIDRKFAGQPLVEASIRQAIGNSYDGLGLFDEAEHQLKAALDLRMRNLGPDHIETAEAMRLLGTIYVSAGKYPQAEKNLSTALTTIRRIRGEYRPETLSLLRELAAAYRYLGNYPKSEQLFIETLDVERRVFGEEHPATLTTMLGLGTLYEKEGKARKSAELIARVVEIRRHKLGDQHPDTLLAMNNLANAYLDDRQFERAEQIYRQVYDIGVSVMGPQHPTTIITLNNLACAYSDEGKYAEAEKVFAQVMELANKAFGPNHPRTMGFMGHVAVLYAREGKFDLAEQLDLKILEFRRRTLGARHPDTVKVLPDLAHVQIELHKYQEAESVVRESMKAHEKLPADAVVRWNDQILLGKCLAGQGKFADAEPVLLAGYEGLRKQTGDADHALRSYLPTAGQWIVQLYRDWGNTDAATQWTRKLESSKIASAAR